LGNGCKPECQGRDAVPADLQGCWADDGGVFVEQTPEDIVKHLVELCRDSQRASNHQLVFRGQSNCCWDLRSSLGRKGLDPGAANEQESKLLGELSGFAPVFLPPNEVTLIQGGDRASRLTVAQHFGSMTRLLDWTTAPLVALYFACAQNLELDAVVWWFDRTELTSAAKKNWDLIGVAREAEAEKLRTGRAWTIDIVWNSQENWVVSVAPQIEFARLASQRGLFTVTNSPIRCHAAAISELFARFPPESRSSVAGRVRVPWADKPDILATLRRLGAVHDSLVDLVASAEWQRRQANIFNQGATR
jgi:hypothetical protein